MFQGFRTYLFSKSSAILKGLAGLVALTFSLLAFFSLLSIVPITFGTSMVPGATFCHAEDKPEQPPISPQPSESSLQPLEPSQMASICSQLLNGAKKDDPNPLFIDYETAKKQVASLLFKKASALKLSRKKTSKLLSMVELPENSKFFDDSLSRVIYGLPASKLTYEIVALSFLVDFTEQQSLVDETNVFNRASRHAIAYSKKKVAWFGSLVMAAVIIGFISTPISQILTPWTEPFGAFVRVQSFKQSEHDPLDIKDDASQAEYHRLYQEIWKEVNKTVPLPEREGRSYFNHTINLSILIEVDFQLLLANRPAKNTSEYKSWISTVQFLQMTLADLPQMFPDFYVTEFGKKVQLHQKDILKEMAAVTATEEQTMTTEESQPR